KPVYQMSFDIHSVSSPGCVNCGDQADGFTDGAGNSCLVLSDGMGSGDTASLAARIAVRTLRRMICSGMPPETAIRLVNALLMTETNTENFATLDICYLDGDTGTITLYKAGAAATLLCRRSKVHRIASRSFPVGIVPDARPSVRQISGLDGDSIVMLSDGISEGEYPYIRQLLQQGLPLKEITRTICEKAAVFNGGQVRDDMTVIAARIRTENLSEMTKSDREATYQHGRFALSTS
ncbi:MAG: SpoIIE family protein phosphatase, partial [Oscillospiraceae bacterium]|nr:SpoIIE family protein phosphatase [Oscillospiraceae bacterium]